MATMFVKDPESVLDYNFDWSGWLDTNETIASFTVTADTGLTVDSSTEAAGKVTAWLSGGTEGTRYKVVCEIVTDAGRTDDRTITIVVTER
jgi:hypothetical protein